MWLVCENPATREFFDRDLVVEDVLNDETNEVEQRVVVEMPAPLAIAETGRVETTAEVGRALCDKYPGAFRAAKGKSDVSAAWAEAQAEAASEPAEDDAAEPADSTPAEGEGE